MHEELDDHRARDDRRSAEFHKCAAVAGENDTHPVEWITACQFHAIEWDLTTHEIDEESNGCPDDLIAEVNTLHRRLDLREESFDALGVVNKSHNN